MCEFSSSVGLIFILVVLGIWIPFRGLFLLISENGTTKQIKARIHFLFISDCSSRIWQWNVTSVISWSENNILILTVGFCALPDTRKFNSGYEMMAYFTYGFLFRPIVSRYFCLIIFDRKKSQQTEKQNMILLDSTLIEQDMISDLYKTNVFNIPYSG